MTTAAALIASCRSGEGWSPLRFRWKTARTPPFSQLAVGVSRTLHDEGVVSVAVVAVVTTQVLIDENRQADSTAKRGGDVQGRVLMTAHRARNATTSTDLQVSTGQRQPEERGGDCQQDQQLETVYGDAPQVEPFKSLTTEESCLINI